MNVGAMELETRIAILERDLWVTRQVVLELLPEEHNALLSSYKDLDATDSAALWREATIEAVTELADPLPQSRTYIGTRAFCPLCGKGTTAQYERGYTVPEGLRRHLEGSGNIQGCQIKNVATQLAYEQVDRMKMLEQEGFVLPNDDRGERFQE